MVTFLIVLLFASLIVIDFVPSYQRNKNNKRFIVFYVIVIIFSFSLLVLKSLEVKMIDTYDIVNFFAQL